MYLVYGAGINGKKFLEVCRKRGIESILVADSNPKLWETHVAGYLICNPETISKNDIDFVIATVAEDKLESVTESIRQYYGDIQIVPAISDCYPFVVGDVKKINLGSLKFKEDGAINHKGIYCLDDVRDSLDQASFNDFDKFIFQKEHHKICKWAHYTEAYERFFSKYRDKDLSILEIGVYGGGSLQLWKSYFDPGKKRKLKIYGIDIVPETKQYEEENISIFIGSQEDRAFLKEVKEQIGKVDIIIDDGGHTMNQQIISFEELFEILDENGIYLCEDTHTSYWKEYGGQYKGDTFIEYAKNLIDCMHNQYTVDFKPQNKYADQIRAISFWDSLVFIEKRKPANQSLSFEVGIVK